MSHFQSQNAVYSTVEEELWLIFTYYALNFDPTLPEQWKSAAFIKFAKDCQIITSKDCYITNSSNSKLSVPMIELEIAKLAKNGYTTEAEKEYNPSSMTIDFSDFLSLLSSISTKLYRRDSMDTATRRILLENVLPLANRRTVLSLRYDSRDTEAIKVIKQFQRGLRHIFAYYVAKAEIRRNNWVADQVTLVSRLSALGSQISAAIHEEENRRMRMIKDVAKQQRDLISYKEFMQFCQDFSIKSTSFLTALQAADVFLQVVPLDSELKSTKGMSFDAFSEALVLMAHLAYRPLSQATIAHDHISTGNKLKALLLYAWKAINNHERTNQLMREHVHVATTIITPSGTHDIFGSAIFSESFLSAWQADNFMEYSVPQTASLSADLSGSKIIRGLTLREGDMSSSGLDNNDSEINREHTFSTSSIGSQRSLSLSPSYQNSSSGMQRRLDAADLLINTTTGTPSYSSSGPAVIRASQLAMLFHQKPELAEYIHLEILNMM